MSRNVSRIVARCLLATIGALLVSAQPGCIIVCKTDRCAHCESRKTREKNNEHSKPCDKPCKTEKKD